MKNVLVIGCARSGYWVSLLLHKNGYRVTITDKTTIKEKSELVKRGIEVFDDGHPEFLIDREWDFIVKNPGIPYTNAFVKAFVDRNVTIYTEVEIATRYAPRFTYAAITGTNGKTTTTTILYEILRKTKNAYASGNIGTALSETVYHHGDQEASIAMEISAFQLIGAPSFHPFVSVIINLTPDHLDYFETLDDYYKAKTLVYHNQRNDDWFLRNIDDENVLKYVRDVPCKVVDFSLSKTADLMIKDNKIMLFGVELFERSDLKIIGRHNLQNAMIAAAMAYKMGVSPEVIREVIRGFRGIEHRIEHVSAIQGVDYYNDSKATNADSTVVALQAFEKPVILIAGGYDKHTGFRELVPYVEKIDKLIVFGATKMELAALKEGAIVCDDLNQAVRIAHNHARQGDVVLFSPACASYDQFNNFEERGRAFKKLVSELSEEFARNIEEY